MITTRFAPSPTGHLHLGHAYSALVAASLGDGYLLRIDDIDHTRSRPSFTEQILADLRWLGLGWRDDPVFQSQRINAYEAGLNALLQRDLIYPCFLNRSEISDILSAPHEASDATSNTPTRASAGVGQKVAPRTYGALSDAEVNQRIDAGQQPAWRLHTGKAMQETGPLDWLDAATDTRIAVSMHDFGDVVLGRKDIGTSYHLSVVIDDAMDNISLVTRGADLYSSTHIHRLLQALLGLGSPAYLHHELLRDDSGKRLAKRDLAKSLLELRESGLNRAEIFALMPEIPTIAAVH